MGIDRGAGSPGSGDLVAWLLKNYGEVVKEHGNVTTSEDISLSDGNVHTMTLTGNTTLTLSNPVVSGYASNVTLIITQDGTGSRTITWPAAVKWSGGTAPTLSTAASSIDVISLFTIDGGTVWYGFSAGIGFA